jgi:hypothetical protein
MSSFTNLLQMIHNSQIRIALERIMALWGMVPGSEGTITATVTGGITGNITGNVTGDLTGDVLAVDTNKVVDVGADVANSSLAAGSAAITTVTGDLVGRALRINEKTPVNAVAAVGTLTISGVVIDGETVIIDGETLEFDADGSYSGTQVDISASMTKSDATLTISGVVIDSETVTINGRVYEFDAHETSTITGDVRVDISEGGTGYSVRSEGELTLANGDVHDDTIIVAGSTSTLKSDATAGSASIINIQAAATHTPGTMILTLGGIPLDGETFVINGRTYEFDTDDDGIVGDVEIDTSASATIDQALTAIETDYNADGSRVANAVADLGNNQITFTSILYGVAANYVCSETMTDGGISGNFTGGANALGTEIGALVLAHYQVGGAGEEATVKAVAGATADKVIFRAFLAGTAGDAITTTHTLTAGSFDAVTLGTKEAGVDCTAANAVTALVAAIQGDGSKECSAADGAGDTVDVTWDVPGTIGDGKVTAEAMANGAWDGNFANGADCSAANAVTALAALTPLTNVSLVDGAGDTVVVTALVKGTAGNAITTTETMANGAFGQGTLGDTTAGVDGTVGVADEIAQDDDYIYICKAANTIADANWLRAAIATF